ncbi:MAG: DUF2778 domain-containing protein [Alphaproteobacteria bacterium]|nr:DUF2778 domain-containing protein [Alphaproteobacteria bacterium]
MRKFLIAFFVAMFSVCTYAADDPKIVLFEVNGKVFYVQDEKLLENLIKSDSCIGGVSEGDILKLYDILYGACEDGIASMINQSNLDKLTKVSLKADQKLRNIAARLAVSKRTSMPINDRLEIVSNALNNCIIDKEMLIETLTKNQTTTSMQIVANIDECIKQIDIFTNINGNNNSCPLTISVPDIKYIENILDLNTSYRLKNFAFPTSGQINKNKVIVFNGNVLVACENNKPVHLVRPTFSGREACQNGQYQNVMGSGGTPNGIYVIREQDIQTLPEKDRISWGKYRVPLIPAQQTDTFRRTNLYLHGTTDPNKHRSGGCISLGIAIDKFIETGFITGVVPLIVNTGTVYQDWLL